MRNFTSVADLSEQDKRNIFTFLSSGITYETLKEIYGLSHSSLAKATKKVRQEKNIDSLQKAGRFERGTENYLKLADKPDKTENDYFLMQKLEEYLFSPIVEEVEKSLDFEELIEPSNEYEYSVYKSLQSNTTQEIMKELKTFIQEQHVSTKTNLRKSFKIKCINKLKNKAKYCYYDYFLQTKPQEVAEILTENEIEVINQRYYEYKTLEEIGEKLEISREWVRQTEKRSLEKVKKYVKAEDPKSIYKFKFSTRVRNFLERKEIKTIDKLAELYQREGKAGLLKHKNVGKKSLKEIERFLKNVDII